jgi:hypothetical protein
MRSKIIALAAAGTIALGSGSTSAASTGSSSSDPNATHAPVAPASSGGSIVVDWNRALLGIVKTPGAQPATVHPTRSFAILHAAIYDAVVSITQDAPPYLFVVSAPGDANVDAAAAVAGHDVLAALYPTMKSVVDQQLEAELAKIPAGQARQDGSQVGAEAALIMLAVRANDGSGATPPAFTPGSMPGNYRPTPPSFPMPAFTNWSSVAPFVLKDATQLRPSAPPALTSQAYADAINEVKSLGQDSSTTRTADQIEIARFWAPPIWNTWNQIAEAAALEHGTNLEQTAALFAALNLTFADGAIAFDDAKYAYQLWRPVTAIRSADTDGNPATIVDPTWTPLAATAPDPSYPGAHSTISAAGAVILAAFFGDRDSIRVTSDALPGVVRSFGSYADVATEAGLSRIYAGQHTRLDHAAGVEMGRGLAAFVLSQSRIGPGGGDDVGN